MCGNPLLVVKEESDLGVTISSDLKHANHCKNAYNKANIMLGFISRYFEYKTPEVMLSLYNSMVYDLSSSMPYISSLLITEKILNYWKEPTDALQR